ncbi:MAG: hypothetical protein ACON3Z_17045 [Bradymonadia bacterium]
MRRERVELHLLEARKALAMEAFIGGHYRQAEEMYAELGHEYQMLEHHEGGLAIAFNRLLIAVEQGRRHLIAERTRDVFEHLEAVQGGQMAQTIARRVCRLFANPIPGADHEVTSALVVLAGSLLDDDGDRELEQADISDLPVLGQYEGLGPLTAAVKLLAAARVYGGHPHAPMWVRRLVSLREGTQPLSGRFGAAFDEYVDAVRSDDLLRAYRSLTVAQAEAMASELDIALHLSVGLMQLEQGERPKKMDFAPNPPPVLRFRQQALLYARLARSLSGVKGAQGLVSKFALAAVDWCERSIEYVLARREHRGQGFGASYLLDAVLTGSRAWRLAGSLQGAASLLERFDGDLSQAQRRPNSTTAELFAESGLVSELLREQHRAQAFYLSLVNGLAPELLGRESVLAQAQYLNDLQLQPSGIALLVKGITGMARTMAADGDGLRFVQLARCVIDIAGEALRGDILAECHLHVELTAAQFSETGAALSALEAARSLGDGPATVMCLLGWAQTLLDTPQGAEQAGALIADAAMEVRLLPRCSIRTNLELAIADVSWNQRSSGDETSHEVMLRRVFETLEPFDQAPCAHGLAVYLKTSTETLMERQVAALLACDQTELARKACLIWSELSLREPARKNPPDDIDWLVREFDCAYLTQVREGFLDWSVVNAAASVQMANGAQRRWSRTSRVPFVEITLFSGRGFCIYGNQLTQELGWYEVDVNRLEAEQFASKPTCRLEEAALRARLTYGLPAITSGPHKYRAVTAPASLLPTFSIGHTRQGMLIPVQRVIGTFAVRSNVERRMVLVGDAMTGIDLSLSRLESSTGVKEVVLRHGDALSEQTLKAALAGAKVAIIFGDHTDSGVELTDGQPAIPYADLVSASQDCELDLLVFMGPVNQNLLSSLWHRFIGSVRHGIIVRVTEGDENRVQLLDILKAFSASADLEHPFMASVQAMGSVEEGGQPYRFLARVPLA